MGRVGGGGLSLLRGSNYSLGLIISPGLQGKAEGTGWW